MKRIWPHVRQIAEILHALAAFPFAVLLWLLRIKVIHQPSVFAIGHQVIEPEIYLKEQELGLIPKRKTILLAPRNTVANAHVSEYWKQYFTVLDSPLLCKLLAPLGVNRLSGVRISHYVLDVYGSLHCVAVNALWGDRAPILRLTESDRARGRDWLRSQGVSGDSWFVCFHAREPGNRAQDSYGAHRNADIRTYIPAMREIVDRGGWVVRMGDPYMQPLPDMPRVIDYAHGEREAWLDVFLCAECKFFVGSQSGLCQLAEVFGVPCAIANLSPPTVTGTAPADICIHKHILRDGRELTYPELLSGEVPTFHQTHEFSAAGYEIRDNTPDEITALVLEMAARVDGEITYTKADDLLQSAYRALLRPGHHSYLTTCRIGREFLRSRSPDLLNVSAADAGVHRERQDEH